MKKLVFAVILGLMVAPAFALTISQTESFSGVPLLTDSLEFDKFDSSLGTLNSIQIIVSLTSSGGNRSASYGRSLRKNWKSEGYMR